MNKSNVIDLKDLALLTTDPLTRLLKSGAQQLIQQAVEAELAKFLSNYTGAKTDEGGAAVVRNGYLPKREILTGVGRVTVQVPKIRSKTGKPVTFRSKLVPRMYAKQNRWSQRSLDCI